MPPHHEIRIRLLGPLRVQRLDGSVVGSEEWRTGKTADLLRLLAIGHGRPVSTDSVIDRLWPGVSPDKARASVRTAASQIRRAIGTNCVLRQNGTMVLTDTWVDVAQFREATRLARKAAREADHRRTVSLAELAERLYTGDFHAYHDHSDWAIAEREELRRLRRDLLCTAADAAIGLGSYSIAVDFAERAVRIDPTSEAASRALMLAYAAVGEVANSLRVYETFRRRLADELGADPSVQTQALHLRLLKNDASQAG